MLIPAMTACAVDAPNKGSAIPVEVAKVDGRYRLMRGGEVYEIRGAGIEFGDVEVFTQYGGNTFRTWRTDNGRMTGREVLDQAQALGLAVAMCIEIGRERHGFDYNDTEAVAAQLEYARSEVLKYKDHPALLAWIIGNEVNLQAKNPAYMDAINDISKMIHEVDGQHPTTTAFAGFNAQLADLARERGSDLDFISIQMYGDIVNLPKYLEETQWDQPYWVTEWGAVGHWEVGKTAWGAPIEQNSSDKAASYQRAWEVALASDQENMLGDFVFYWGQKQERTPTWYGMFLADGSKTEAIDVMHRIWTGGWPANRSPQVGELFLADQLAAASVTLAAGELSQARIDARDADGDDLDFHWEVMRESTATQSGGDKEEVPETLPGLVTVNGPGRVELSAPQEPGAYRLFVYVYDGQGNAAHANIPFLVR
jgi:hypothetical protein